MIALFIVIAIAVWALWVAKLVSDEGGYPPYQDSCTQDCAQGRQCTCGWPGTTERCTAVCNKAQAQHQLDDEFNNANWPFPVQKP